MNSRGTQSAQQILELSNEDEVEIEPTIIDEYKKLDETCDKVLKKIKRRKVKKQKAK